MIRIREVNNRKCALLVNCSLEAIKIQLVDAWRLRSFLGATCWKNCVSSNFCSKNRDISGSLKYLKIINKIILIRKFYFKIGKNFNKDRTLSLLIFLSSRSKKHIISHCVSPNSSIWKRKRKRHQSRNRGAIRVTPHCVRVHSACIGVYTTAYKQAAYF